MGRTLGARAGGTPDISEDPYRRSSLDPPSWRGRKHAAMVLPAVAAGIWLIVVTPGAGARIVIALYAASLVVMFAVSAVFHLRRWSDVDWLRMRRLDHSAIYLLIAGSYGAIMGLGVSGWPSTWLVGVAVGLCAVGIALRWLLLHPPFGLMTTLFLVTGGVSMIAIREILDGIGVTGTIVVLIGCVLYGVGSLALGLRRPNPWPGHFGYHEVWHLNVIAGSGCQFWVVAFVVVPAL
jgi:hemolysin III